MNGVMYGAFVVPGSTRVVVLGGDGNDGIFATDARRPVEISGEVGHDQIVGRSFSDLLDGGSGWDRVWGGAGNDLIFGGDTYDFLYGRKGADLIVGGAGDDIIDGHDILIGGTGSDCIKGNGGESLLIGGSTTYDNNTGMLVQIGYA